MNKGLKLFLGFIPLVTLCILVFWFSSKNAVDSTSQSDIFVKLLKEQIMPSLKGISSDSDIKIVDHVLAVAVRKSAHFIAYMTLGMCAFGAFWFITRKGMRYFVSVIICAAYAGSDEIHQLFVEGRTGKLRDVIIDTSGACAGALICLMVVLIIEMQGMKDEIAELREQLEQRQLQKSAASSKTARKNERREYR